MGRESDETDEGASRHAKSFLSFAALSTVLYVTLAGGTAAVSQTGGTALAVVLAPIWIYLNTLRLFKEIEELVVEQGGAAEG
ncbi:MAG: hypothetical protein ABEJ43_09215 [Haloferacaceae archaeon]